eukprot:5636961-Alexandrium_andersonii.AAC.1
MLQHPHPQEKLKEIRNAPDGEKQSLRQNLSASEKQRLWKQFEYERKNKAPTIAIDAFERVCSSDFRCGKVAANNEMLWAWLD